MHHFFVLIARHQRLKRPNVRTTFPFLFAWLFFAEILLVAKQQPKKSGRENCTRDSSGAKACNITASSWSLAKKRIFWWATNTLVIVLNVFHFVVRIFFVNWFLLLASFFLHLKCKFWIWLSKIGCIVLQFLIYVAKRPATKLKTFFGKHPNIIRIILINFVFT